MVRRIEQIQVARRARDRRVEPAEVVRRQLGLMAFALHKHMVPLTALRLVAGDGVTELEPQGIEIRIRHQGILERLSPPWQVLVAHAEVEVERLVLI